MDTLTFSIGISLTGACGTDTCTWQNAFGIQGLNLDSLSGTIGVDFETADAHADDLDQGRQPRAAAGVVVETSGSPMVPRSASRST